MMRKISVLALALSLLAMTAAGCGSTGSGTASEKAAETASPVTTAPVITTNLAKPDMTKWQYSADDDVYYQTGLAYCEKPADDVHEKLAVFVPSAYLDASDNGDGTYTCKVNESAVKNGYTAAKAPILMPIFSEGYYTRALPRASPTSRRRSVTCATAVMFSRATRKASSSTA